MHLADRRRRLHRLTQACPPNKLYTRIYTLRRPFFPARLAARGPRWLHQALASSAQLPSKHRPTKLSRSAPHAVGSCFCSAACGDVLDVTTPSATDARGTHRTASQSRRWNRFPETGIGGTAMIRTKSHFARGQCTKVGSARPPPGVRYGRRARRGQLRSIGTSVLSLG